MNTVYVTDMGEWLKLEKTGKDFTWKRKQKQVLRLHYIDTLF